MTEPIKVARRHAVAALVVVAMYCLGWLRLLATPIVMVATFASEKLANVTPAIKTVLAHRVAVIASEVVAFLMTVSLVLTAFW